MYLSILSICLHIYLAYISAVPPLWRRDAGMYPHIQEAIARGDVLLEWDYSKGSPPKPLVKDVYGT